MMMTKLLKKAFKTPSLSNEILKLKQEAGSKRFDSISRAFVFLKW